MKRLLTTIAMLFLLLMVSGVGQTKQGTPGVDTTIPPHNSSALIKGQPTAGSYVLVAWSELGMHCIDGKDYSVFSVLPPYNVIHAQLFKKGEPPVPITSGVTITYQATADTTGSVNSSSARKTNFWRWVNALFHVSLPPETGLAGYKTQSLAPQMMTYNAAEGYWEGVGIPTVPYDDKLNFNAYPMANLVAKDSGGTVLATAKIVLAISDELSCSICHASGTDPNAMPAGGWANNPNPARDTKLNILKKHDDRWDIAPYLPQLQAGGYNYKSTLFSTATSGTPVLCAACHGDNALGLPGITPIASLSSDMHSLHGPQILISNGGTLDENSLTSDLNSCYLCHPGPATQCKRGAMNAVLCSDCHGDLSTVSDANRDPWFIEPSCQMCHNTSQRYTTTFDNNHQWRQTTDTTFATNDNVPLPGANLYRFSLGHGGVFCSACHGSPHAEFPTLQANDNVYPKALQKYAAKITECSVCHTNSLTATANGGPHGIHKLGQSWVNAHGNYVESHGYQACGYCHGGTYQGSFLSETKVKRTFQTENGSKTFSAGHQFNCYDCHNGPGGD
jgi:Outer membrane cytochrome MtrC/MtrF-like, domains II/IV